MSQKPRFFTGIQATGALALSHYLGVIRHLLTLQEEYEIIVMVADLHSLTVPNQEFNYQEKAYEIASLLYSCGLKENCKIFIQSQIKEHLELTHLLSPHITVSTLTNMIQYKEKKRNEESGNAALLNYPILMAADIFLYDADLVIVGQDQKQHLELTEHLSQKFNAFYQKKLLKLPKFTIPHLGGKIMDLQNPTKKMSKSETDYLALLDNPTTIKEKIARAITDSENQIYYDLEKKPGIANLLTIYALLKNLTLAQAEEEVKNLNYHQFKNKLVLLINTKLETIQRNFSFYQGRIDNLLEKNRIYLQELAAKKLKKIKESINLVS